MMPVKKKKVAKRSAAKKKVAKKSVRKTTKKKTKKKVAKSLKLTNHSRNCLVCKHKDIKEIEGRYLQGDSSYSIAEDFVPEDKKRDVFAKSIIRHANALKLNEKRDNSTLTQVRKIINRARIDNRPISDALLGKALELQAKITGELKEKHVNLFTLSDDELKQFISDACQDASASKG